MKGAGNVIIEYQTACKTHLHLATHANHITGIQRQRLSAIYRHAEGSTCHGLFSHAPKHAHCSKKFSSAFNPLSTVSIPYILGPAETTHSSLHHVTTSLSTYICSWSEFKPLCRKMLSTYTVAGSFPSAQASGWFFRQGLTLTAPLTTPG